MKRTFVSLRLLLAVRLCQASPILTTVEADQPSDLDSAHGL
jgi:hypothetical protein